MIVWVQILWPKFYSYLCLCSYDRKFIFLLKILHKILRKWTGIFISNCKIYGFPYEKVEWNKRLVNFKRILPKFLQKPVRLLQFFLWSKCVRLLNLSLQQSEIKKILIYIFFLINYTQIFSLFIFIVYSYVAIQLCEKNSFCFKIYFIFFYKKTKYYFPGKRSDSFNYVCHKHKNKWAEDEFKISFFFKFYVLRCSILLSFVGILIFILFILVLQLTLDL